MGRKTSAFSLVEAIIVVLFIGILAAIAVPRFNFAIISKHKAEVAARKTVTDLRRTRRFAISDATNNVQGFALNMTGSAPYTAYEILNLDTSTIVDSHTIDSEVTCTGGNRFEFAPLGNLKAGSDTRLRISAEGRTFTITIIPATGMIKCGESKKIPKKIKPLPGPEPIELP
jgi:Tfp pilus assembly protein FimT